MLNARSIQGILILATGLFVSIWLGLSIATNQSETLIQVASATVFIIALFLGQRIWLLLIFFSAANVVIISGFGTQDIGQALFLSLSLAMFLLRRLRLHLSFGELELWIMLIVICIIQVYMRNPVGLNVFGGATVGARPYLMVAMSIATALVLSSYKVDPKEIKWAMGLSLIGAIANIPGTMLRYGSLTTIDEEMTRIPSLATFGQLLANWLSSRISPLRACVRPLWAFVLLVSVAAAAGSGYRNAVAGVLMTYFFGICYHGGVRAVFFSFLAGSVSLILLAFINSNAPLPGNIQRALTILPGTWEREYRDGADSSTEWRVEMWKEALTSSRWIQNKTFGDGLGMTAAQLSQNQAMTASRAGRSSYGLLVQQENMLINGSYHSGPVQTIRTVGYVGLAVLLMAMIRVSIHAHRQILRCRGTEWHPVALFFGIPLLVHPIFFVFVFGEFHAGVSVTVLGIAMIRLMEKNLPLPEYAARKVSFIPLNTRAHIQPARASTS